jgi:hypothetical protein
MMVSSRVEHIPKVLFTLSRCKITKDDGLNFDEPFTRMSYVCTHVTPNLVSEFVCISSFLFVSTLGC